MTEYKSKYINKTWNEITTSFDWVNCQPINCRISHHKKHYDLQRLEWAKMYLNLFKNNWDVIASYMQHYKINDILDLASDGWKILQIDKKIKGIIYEVYMKKLNKICLKQRYWGYCFHKECNQENKLQELMRKSYSFSFEDMTDKHWALGKKN